LPCYKLAPLQSDIFASYSGPDSGLALVHDLELQVSDTAGEFHYTCGLPNVHNPPDCLHHYYW